MSSKLATLEQINQKKIQKDSDAIFELLEGLRKNLGQLFLHVEGKKTLHERYLEQRKRNAWELAERIDSILREYPQTKTLNSIIQTVLHIYSITQGIREDRIDTAQIVSISDSLINASRGGKSGTLLIAGLLEKTGMKQEGVDRFLGQSLERELNKKPNT